MRKHRLTRRQFLRASAAISGSLAVSAFYRLLSKAAPRDLTNTDMPMVVKAGLVMATARPTSTRTAVPDTTPTSTKTAVPDTTPTPTPSPTITPTSQPHGSLDGRVIHVRGVNATNWNGSGDFYSSDAIDQSVVDTMTLQGLQLLTNQSSWGNIWQVLFTRIQPNGYVSGQKIAIKVNFNNSGRDGNGCSVHDGIIDALPQPVISLLTGLVAAGVQPSDVVVFDATGGYSSNTDPGRIIPDYFRDPITSAYPEVSFFGKNDCGVTPTTYGKDASLTVSFNDPEGYLLDRQLADILYDATYLIDMPILKGHGGDNDIPATLAFKNHFGSINYVYSDTITNDNLHDFTSMTGSHFHSDYSPLVNIYNNSNIKNKTILTVGEGLYGASEAVSPPYRYWTIFGGDGANSLFFAVDPVASDCVMTDLIRAEGWFSTNHAYDYLFCAQEADLGLCEGSRNNPGGDPLQTPYGSGYATLDYTRIDVP